jgi:hypothetical protein
VVRLKSGSRDTSNPAIQRMNSTDGNDNAFAAATARIRRDRSNDGSVPDSSFTGVANRGMKEYKSADDGERFRAKEEKLFDQLFKEKRGSITPNPNDPALLHASFTQSGDSPLSTITSDQLLEKNRDRFLWICRSFLSRLYNTVHRIPRPIRLLIQRVVNVVNGKFPGQATSNNVASCLFFLRFLCPEIISRKGLLEAELRKDPKMADKLLSVDQTLVFLVKFLQYLGNGNWDAAGKMDFCNDTLKNESENIQVCIYHFFKNKIEQLMSFFFSCISKIYLGFLRFVAE